MRGTNDDEVRSGGECANSGRIPGAGERARSVTITLTPRCVAHFAPMAAELGVTLGQAIGLFLDECITQRQKVIARQRERKGPTMPTRPGRTMLRRGVR